MLAGPQVQHPAPVVGLLEQQPVALDHLAGQDLGHAEALQDVLAVLGQLDHLALEVLLLVDPHPELAAVLWSEKSEKKTKEGQATVRSRRSGTVSRGIERVLPWGWYGRT